MYKIKEESKINMDKRIVFKKDPVKGEDVAEDYISGLWKKVSRQEYTNEGDKSNLKTDGFDVE